MADLVLASSSKYRRHQLMSLGYHFQTIAPRIDERPLQRETPHSTASRLSTLKATSIAQAFPGSVIVGSDQTGSCNGHRLVKPKTFNNALDMLLSYRGQTVCFFTAVTVLDPTGASLTDVIQTEVQFRDFTKSEATSYLTLDQPLDCVGAIKSEVRGPLLFHSVRSEDPTALIGLPLIRTAEFLRQSGINPLEDVDPKTLQNKVGEEL